MARPRIRIVGPQWGRQQRFVVGSLIVHVVLAATLVWASGLSRGPRIPHDAMMVELVGMPAGPAAAAVQAQPEPARQAAPEPPPPPPPTEGVTMQDEPTEQPKPKPKEEKPEPRRPAQVPPAPVADEPGAATGDGVGGAVASGSAATGASVSALIGGDAAFDWYRSAVTAALYSRWQRPILSGVVEPQEVQVDFEIMRDGRVRGLRVEVSSGIPSLDRSALRAVSDATPLPPLPSTLRDPYVPASFVFRLYPDGP